MKRNFKQYAFKLLKDASGPDKNPEHYDPTLFGLRLNGLRKECEEMKKEMPPEMTREIDDGDVVNVLTTANAEHALWRGKGVHTFIDPDTEAVIHRAISKLDNEALARYRPKTDIGILYLADKNPIMYNFSADDGKSACINDESMGIFRMDDLTIMTEENSADGNLKQLKENLRFVSGCFMMQECFPDVFKEGVPSYVRHPNWFKNLSARSISVDRVERGVCPHIRSGHFRLLSSDKYVHKKGQIVFVKSAMVKGRANHTKLGALNAKKVEE